MDRKCNRCLIVKPKIEFHKCVNTSDGIQHVCKVCRREQSNLRYPIRREKIIAHTLEYRSKHKEEWKKYSIEYRIKNKDKIRMRKVLTQYNISAEEYKELLLKQEKGCAICKNRDFSPKIDHDHKTGKIRGILCFNCNCALGGFKDDTRLLETAILYLNDNNRITNTKLP